MPLEVLLNAAPMPPLVGSVSISGRVNSRTTAKLDWYDRTGSFLPAFGDTVEIRVTDPDADDLLVDATMADEEPADGDDPVETLFGGSIKRIGRQLLTRSFEEPEGVSTLPDELEADMWPPDEAAYRLHHSRFSVECLDYSELADRVLVTSETWTSQTLKQIVDDIITTYFSGFAISTSNVPTGPTIASYQASYQFASEIFDGLSKLTGYSWYIDEFRNLWFVLPGDHFAPTQFSESSENWRNIQIDYDAAQYRNRQYVERSGGTVSYRENAAEISANGPYERLEREQALTTSQAADDYADGLLRRYARVIRRVQLETFDRGIKAGQLIQVFWPSLDVEASMLVESVDVSIPTEVRNLEPHLIFRLSLVDDEPIGDYRDWFKRRFRLT